MTALDTARAYFEAWNRRDPDAIVATFTSGGTYADPASDGELGGAAIGAYAARLFTAFPDLHFEEVGAPIASGETVATQWVMHGENAGPLYEGLPPTGKTVALPGTDIITVGPDGITSVRGCFDRSSFVEQLGLQVIVQPHQVGPMTFGHSVRSTLGNTARPGVVGLTWIEPRADEDRDRVRNLTRDTIQEIVGLPGFITAVTGFAGQRGFTVTAWEDEAAAARGIQSEAHRKAMVEVLENGVGAAAFTSLWTPSRLNRLLVRCGSCGQIADAGEGATTCSCGVALPAAPQYW